MGKRTLSARKAAHFETHPEDIILSHRAYNLLIGGITAYGLIMNFIICRFFRDVFVYMNPALLYGGYFVLGISGILLVCFCHKPAITFLGYNMIVLPLGAVLSTIVAGIHQLIIFQTCGLTGSITVIMLCLSVLFPQFFLRIGRVLFVSLFAMILVGLFCMVFRMNLSIYSYISAGIFSLYIGYDWARANSYPHTLKNAVEAACELYIDIANLFIDILAIVTDN